MAVPDLPYWGLEIHKEINTKGTQGMQPPAVLAKIAPEFWMSEFKNFALSATASASIPGVYAGDDGPSGAPGNIGNYHLPWAIFARNYRSSSWRANRDIAFRGVEVTDEEVLALGLNPAQVPVCSTPIFVRIVGVFPYYCGIGEYRFNMSNPWSGLRGIRGHYETWGGRNWCKMYVMLNVPRANEVVVPAWADNQDRWRGSHSLSINVRYNDPNAINYVGASHGGGSMSVRSVFVNGSYDFRGTSRWPVSW